MEIKKSPKADLESKKSTWLLVGYVIVLAFMFVAFEWTKRDIKIDTSQAITDVFFEEEIIPITEQPEQVTPPPPEAPSIAETLTIVEDDADVEETAIVSSEELNQAVEIKYVPVAVEEEEPEENASFAKELGLLAVGAVLIAVGANLLVDNGTLIAQALGVPESVIALTFVALGTSLPELVTAITSLIKGHSDLSVGNVVGANVFNLVLVSGVSVTLAPFTIPQSSTLFGVNSSLVLDLPVMLAVMLIMTVPALVKGKMNRAQGIILLAIYAAFCAIQFTM